MYKAIIITVLLGFISSGYADSEKELERNSKKSKEEVSFEKCMALTAQAFGTNQPLGYAIGVESSVRKVFGPISTFLGKAGTPARISLARGEYESVQVVVMAGRAPLRSVRVSVSDLTGPDGVKLPASNIKIHLVGYVEVTNHPEKDEAAGQWWPDPLLGNAPFGVEALHAQPIWVTVHAPATAQSGEYRGFLTVAPKGSPEIHLPLHVKIWNFELSPKNHLKTTFPLFWKHERVSRSEFKQWAKFALSYRLGIMTVGWGESGIKLGEWGVAGAKLTSRIRKTDKGYNFSKIDVDLKFCFDRNMNSVSMGDSRAGVYVPEYMAEWRKFLGDYANHLKKRGWFEMCYYKLQDEPSPQMYKVVRDQGKFIKSIDPDIKRLCTVKIVPELVGAVDIWCPLTSDYDKKQAAAARKRGEEVWTYTCMGPLPPSPNIAFIRQDALGHRMLPWQCWELGATGYLFWGIKNWPQVNTGRGGISAWSWAKDLKFNLEPQEQAGEHWPRLPWLTREGGLPAGDGYVAYPGPKGVPLPSIRLECFRDGIEDYEYLFLLRKRAEDLRKAEKNDEAARAGKLLAEAEKLGAYNEKNWDPNPGRLLDLRVRIAEELSK